MPIPSQAYEELHLLPSILSADFSRLGEQIEQVMDAGARMIHFDVMDGHFVPNITIGPAVLKSLAGLVHERAGYFSVHLMIDKPEDYLKAFIDAGADAVSIHAEASAYLCHSLHEIRKLGAAAGIAINPGTGVSAVEPVRDMIDYALVMTVNPGFGGQAMIEPALDKVSVLRQMLPQHVAIEVDGGVHEKNIGRVVKMGGNWIVAGSAVFDAEDPGERVRKLQAAMTA